MTLAVPFTVEAAKTISVAQKLFEQNLIAQPRYLSGFSATTAWTLPWKRATMNCAAI
jgi:hypothetical protein